MEGSGGNTGGVFDMTENKIDNTGGDLFDYARAREERESAIDAVAIAREHWLPRFKSAICVVAQELETFTSDDVLKAFPNLEECEEKRVIGAAFRSLSGEVIEPLGYRNSNRRKSHARPKRVWRAIKAENKKRGASLR
jgi:hypothetical protein